MIDPLTIQRAILDLQTRIAQADRQFDDWILLTEEDYGNPSWLIESCILQLLAITEALGLAGFRQMLDAEYREVQASKKGFTAYKMSPDGEPYSLIVSRIRCYLRSLQGFFPEEPFITVTKDVLQILRDIHYVITDKKIFGSAPANESDVHLRIEGILRCVFPDLKHKPSLTKQIKNFEPDTGIPSVRTLIEYKFLSRVEDVGPLADQILADTRGYTSPEWKRFLYVIYETNRFRKESEWNQLLRESDVPESTAVVILSGEAFVAKRVVRKITKKGPAIKSSIRREPRRRSF